MITYNHELYIKKSIEGVLSQSVNFPIEIIIADDCSPDKTYEIVTQIINSHPRGKQIKYFRHSKNLGPVLNSIWTLKHAKGKYIALCEGDDYWTDNLKLQKQVNFLEINTQFSFCFHDVFILNETQNVDYRYHKPKKSILLFKDILFKHYIPTCSLVFRKNLLPFPLPNWFYNMKMLDLPIELLLSDKGEVKYFSETMAVYRQSNNSLTRSKEQIKNGRTAYVYMYFSLIRHFRGKHFLNLFYLYIWNKIGLIKDKIVN